MRPTVSEKTVKIISAIVIACWLPILVSFMLLEIAWWLFPVRSNYEYIGMVITPPISLFVIISMYVMTGIRLSILTIAASAACIAIAIPKVKCREWKPQTIYLAAIALLGHLSFLFLPHPPGESWLRTIGLGP